jgi:hypothetical protein
VKQPEDPLKTASDGDELSVTPKKNEGSQVEIRLTESKAEAEDFIEPTNPLLL